MEKDIKNRHEKNENGQGHERGHGTWTRTWKHGRGHGNIKIWTRRHGDLETWRIDTWKHGDMETWRNGDMETWRNGDMETWKMRHENGGLDMETWTWRHG
jgi:hypothetical protein